MSNKERNLALQVQTLILFKLRVKKDDIIKITKFFQQTIYILKAKAIKQGCDLLVSLQLTNGYLKDDPRTYCPAISLE